MGLYSNVLPWYFDWIATGGTVLAAGAGTTLYLLQKRLIYVPQFPPGSRLSVWKPSQFGWEHFEELWLKSADGTKIQAYWMPYPHHAGPKTTETDCFRHLPTIYFCHVLL